MSHEGIRFVSEEAARQASAIERELPRDAITPERVRVNKTEGTGVDISWKDGHRSHWSFAWLRDACPCATCIEEREMSGREPGQPKPQPATVLPIFKAAVRPKEVRSVGRYAIAFDWNDGHTSGIYSWHYLRSMCQCAACKAEASRSAATS
ncbi:MAG TPA: DUF971 domain-containing protein [Acidobacteriaceae bacterium]|nr:DUF971 domain-containing protein [Acidobacteriaceae bacterium]